MINVCEDADLEKSAIAVYLRLRLAPTFRMSWDDFCRLASFSGVTTGMMAAEELAPLQILLKRIKMRDQENDPISFT